MKIILGITGASGAIYGVRLLEELRKSSVEVHLIISKWARYTISHETGQNPTAVEALADYVYQEENMAAGISSGSFPADGMVIAPCSMKTLGGISAGISDGLIGRAADVSLKEGRKLILVARETPLSTIHISNMLTLSKMGVVIMPPVPAFYTQPKTVEEIVDQTVGRILDQLGIKSDLYQPWGE